MNILVDIGNSRLKWAWESASNLNPQTPLLHQQYDWQTQLFNAWQTLETPEVVAISSVAQQDMLLAVITLVTRLWSNVEIMMPKSQAEGFGVKNSYQQPERLGVDRWLCLIAARHYYPQATWIIDCGTAITVDYLDGNGVHGGGLITPGLTLMKKSLLQNTAALNFSAQQYALGLANITEAAIFSGTLYAAIGLIEQALKNQAAATVILLTGGDAAIIKAQLSYPTIIDPDLVLKGLAVFSHSAL